MGIGKSARNLTNIALSGHNGMCINGSALYFCEVLD